MLTTTTTTTTTPYLAPRLKKEYSPSVSSWHGLGKNVPFYLLHIRLYVLPVLYIQVNLIYVRGLEL